MLLDSEVHFSAQCCVSNDTFRRKLHIYMELFKNAVPSNYGESYFRREIKLHLQHSAFMIVIYPSWKIFPISSISNNRQKRCKAF